MYVNTEESYDIDYLKKQTDYNESTGQKFRLNYIKSPPLTLAGLHKSCKTFL